MSRLLRALGALSLGTALAVTGAVPASAAVTPPSAPVPNYDDGLFGSPDVFSAAYKQALALLAISTLDDSQVSPDDETAVNAGLDWLAAQQCPDGGWQGYKISGVDCGPLSTDFSDPLAFVNEDSNTTALVVQAFAAFGVEDEPVPSALDFLKTLQQADGGFAFSPGSGSDPNSTALVIQALLAVGTDPATLTKGAHTPYSYLQSQQLDCTADPADQGALQAPFAPGSANAFATVQSVPGLAKVPYPVPQADSITPDGPHLECATPLLRKATKATSTATSPSPAATASAAPETAAPESAAPDSAAPQSAEPTQSASAEPTPTQSASAEPTANASESVPATAAPGSAPTKAATLIRKPPAPAKAKAKPALAAATPEEAAALAASWVADQLTSAGYLDNGLGGVDYASTAYAVLGFAATGTNGTALTKALAFLQSHLSGATTKGGADEIGGLSLTALAAFAGGLDPTDFANSDLIARIEALQYFTPEAPVVEPPVVTPVDQPVGGGVGSAGGGLPFTGFSTDTVSQLALLMLLLGAALIGSTHLRAPARGRHAA
jgi:hypothetical protein